MTLNYNSGTAADPSSIDQAAQAEQMQTFVHLKKALVESRKEQYFTQLAKTEHMPKHFGKTMKVSVYVPLLDDRNINDQGIDANGVAIADGNLYGSSKDIGKITSRLPELNEAGGRVNRVGFTRLSREGSLHEYGFFFELTEDLLNFDSDADLKDHLARELINGAVQMSEAILQMDLLAAAGTHVYAGNATSKATITGEAGTPSVVSYANFSRADAILFNNRTPKHTTVITGSRNVDTKTIPAARIAYFGSELRPLITGMKDQFQNQAFIPVQKYAAAASAVEGEVGSIDAFRLVEVPEMLHWAGAGADATGGGNGYRISNGKYNVYPILIVGTESFTTIGFQTAGGKAKFNIITKMPSRETANFADPYGKRGFSSIRWYYGFLSLRPERIAVIYTVAPV